MRRSLKAVGVAACITVLLQLTFLLGWMFFGGEKIEERDLESMEAATEDLEDAESSLVSDEALMEDEVVPEVPLELPEEKTGLEMRFPFVHVSDEAVERWFALANEEMESSEEPLDVSEVKIAFDELEKEVSEVVSTFRKYRHNLYLEMIEEPLISMLDEVLNDAKWKDSSSDHSQQEKSEKEKILTLKPRRDKCGEWKGKMADDQSQTFKLRSFSISPSVSQDHADLWREAFRRTGQGWKENLKLEDFENHAHQMLVLPLSHKAEFISGNLPSKERTYRVTLNRFIDSNNWPSFSVDQELILSIAAMLKSYGCDGGIRSRIILPLSYLIGTSRFDCEEFFQTEWESSGPSSIWILKKVSQNGTPQFLQGTEALKRKYGRCTGSSMPILLQQSVVQPLLIHSRRIKWHVLVLVSQVSPIISFVHTGFISLASPEARTDSSGGVGSTLSNVDAMLRETTNLDMQPSYKKRGDIEPPLWDFERFKRHLISFDVCKEPCTAVWEKAKELARLLVSMSREGREEVSSFQVFRVELFVTEELELYLHKASKNIGFLMRDYGLDATWLREEMSELFKEAIALSEHPNAEIKKWESLHDEFKSECGEVTEKSLCERFPFSKLQRGKTEPQRDERTQTDGNDHEDNGENLSAEIGKIVSWDQRTSPQRPLTLERRETKKCLDCMF